MKILYRQSDNNGRGGHLSDLGVYQCYLKSIAEKRDASLATKKEHSHTGYEIHIVTEGKQIYEIYGNAYTVGRGSFLLIPPRVRHRIVSSDAGARKYSLSFGVQSDTDSPILHFAARPVCRKCTDSILEACERVNKEFCLAKGLSSALVECGVFEILILVLRLAGFDEGSGTCEVSETDARLELARKYIRDNVEQNLSVSDVSSYCYISEKQLTRLFLASEGVPVGEYIRKRRALRIEELLLDKTFSLEQISRIMNFNNEYYFNSFFKREYGMPPGEYRKTLIEK